jgi:hypothetical protein
MTARSRLRRLLAAAAIGIGVVMVIAGAWLETRNPRTNSADNVAWCVLFAGMFSLGIGISLPFRHPIVVLLIGIASPVVGWFLLECAYCVALSYDRWPSQERMVPSGYQMIPEAKQIDKLFGPAWHELSNYEYPDIAEWQTDAFFGGRYELEMSVKVRIDRHSGKVTNVLGEPHFILLEIREIKDLREVGYDGNHQREFGADEWRRIVNANGDFNAIGIQLNQNRPLADFEKYRAEPRYGIQFRPNGTMMPRRIQ